MGNCINRFLISDEEIKPNEISELEMYLTKYNNKFNNLDDSIEIINHKNNYILENTPYGNVYMTYNADENIFLYFSDKRITNLILEVLAKKYVIQFNCKCIYHKNIETLNENKENEIDTEEKENEESSVYGKFKNKRKFLKIPIIKSNINHYKYLGRLDDFNILQADKNTIPATKEDISYEDFLKLSNLNE
tara:strand:- start:213 stop:785 length:573 start_codon:yes stop_codon:yes gene_type:complete